METWQFSFICAAYSAMGWRLQSLRANASFTLRA